MSENENIIDIRIPTDHQAEYIAELTDFIENELQPPSKLRWLIIFFVFGLMGGVGLGVLISWLR